VFNANPLVRFDGYFMFADWLEVPNLRERADRLFQEVFGRHCLGLKTEPDPFRPESGTGWFATYAVAAAVYRWVVLFGILYFLATVLKPYGLQSLGLTAASVSLGLVVGGLLWKLGRMLAAPRSEPLSRLRMTCTLLAAGGIVGLVALVPIPWHVEGACLVEPEGVVHVYNPLGGRLAEIAVAPGERVAAGTVLVRLVDEELDKKHRALRRDFEKQRVQVKLQHALGENTQHALALERLRDLAEQLEESAAQRALLEVKAPVAGTVVAAPRVAPPADPEPLRLGTWTGNPLERRNLGAMLEQRTHLLSLAPGDPHRAVIYVDQADRDDVAVGQGVELKLDEFVERTLSTKVESFAERHAEFVPPSLSNKHGGPLPTVTDESGQERLASTIAYQATAVLPDSAGPVLTGLRGTARFDVGHRSLGGWLWRAARRTLRFRL
jgi:putative peptide zinc metalloprotease protein